MGAFAAGASGNFPARLFSAFFRETSFAKASRLKTINAKHFSICGKPPLSRPRIFLSARDRSVLARARSDRQTSSVDGKTTVINRSFSASSQGGRWETAFGYARNFLNNRFVYVVISPRARGLSVGVNMNPARRCNFDCIYCEVDRNAPLRARELKVPVMIEELKRTLGLAQRGRLSKVPELGALPPDLLQPRHVTLSGDGEPTLCPVFRQAVQAVIHLRALGELPFFKVVLVSNATGLDRPEVREGLRALSPEDEVWLKLDGGTEAHIARVNRPSVPLAKILDNIRQVGRERPVVIQSLFAQCSEQQPDDEEIGRYIERLQKLQADGAQISLVQIYSAMRPTMDPTCRHLPLRTLSSIAQRVRAGTGLRVEVF
jgi:wyosine [tRNA(Phe)-imidazoG37] synthetase (radical SAM superfamily)